MSRPNPGILAGFMGILLVFFVAASLLKGGLYVDRHEGDTLHLLDILMRMQAGQVPHRDFATPIGVLAFLPITVFQWLGAGPGMAFLLAQCAIGLLLAPLVFHIAVSRMRGGAPYLFAALMMVLIFALIHGGSDLGQSVSMHYNRWAWALAFCAILLAVVTPELPQRPGVDGALIGLCMAALVLLKITYFVAFALPVALALMLRGAWRSLAFALAAGLLVAAIATALGGIDFWAGYLRDLTSVAASETRPAPGHSLGLVLAGASHLPGTVLLLAAVVLLRRGGRDFEGLILLILAAGFIYVTWQNFGNAQHWLFLVAMLLLALPPRSEPPGGPTGRGQFAVTVAALALIAPDFVNMAQSQLRHLGEPPEEYVALVPALPDVQAARIRNLRVDAEVAYEDVVPQLAPFVTEEERMPVVEFRGEALPRCTQASGAGAMYRVMADQLHAAELNESAGLFVADTLQTVWLYGPFRPVQGAEPWYYGGLPGWADADYLLIPLCPIAPHNRDVALQAITEAGTELEEVARTDLFILYRKS